MHNLTYIFCIADNTAYDPSPESDGTADWALSLERLSNVARTGLWVFRVDGTYMMSGGIIILNYEFYYTTALLPLILLLHSCDAIYMIVFLQLSICSCVLLCIFSLVSSHILA